MLDLSIIILNYNTKELLEKCLESIYEAKLKSKFEVIVVDNASSDDSSEMVSHKFPLVILLKSKSNLGYSKGNNLGLSHAQGKYILFLNSDTEIVGQAPDAMLKCLNSHKKVGIIGPRLIYPNQSVQRSAGNFYTLGNTFLMLLGLQRIGMLRSSPNSFKLVDWISGACYLARKKVFSRIGNFDEKLFMYMEEMEFCYRAKKNGILTAICPDATVIHKERGSATDGKSGAILNIYKGLLYFYRKYFNQRDLFFLKLVLRTKALFVKSMGIVFRNNYLIKTYDEAYKLVK